MRTFQRPIDEVHTLPLTPPKGGSKNEFKNKFPYISVIDEANDFKFGMQLVFAKAHHQIPPEKSGCGPGLGELPEIWGFPFIISATAEASDFKFGTQLEFFKAHDKIAPSGKTAHGLGLGKLPNILEFPIFLQ